ncbi:hypothetical protein Maq22A_c13010 [Methylobacterium aquaticum]|uniref:Uncharacterized protein n=1 Tax=Methylobacterium aquaticum TaxID=270351 RepID=A0A0C6FBL7_9HYPH|nr:hypothetical protein Maq22A_c13010 [Methylobacterium aquaticum]
MSTTPGPTVPALVGSSIVRPFTVRVLVGRLMGLRTLSINVTERRSLDRGARGQAATLLRVLTRRPG